MKTIGTDYKKNNNSNLTKTVKLGYHIDRCPSCSDDIDVRHQRKVIYGRKNNYTADIGDNQYFVINKCIHVRFKADVQSFTGLSMRKAESL